MNNKTIFFSTLIKGAAIGGTMLVPGVSGGSMAMILGIYNKLISSVSSFSKNVKENFLFLLVFVIGAGIGILTFARPLLSLIETYPKPMLFGILGAVAGGLPMIYKEAKVSSFSFKQSIYVLLGVLIVLGFNILPMNSFYLEGSFSHTLFLLLSGFLAAIALVLPGISVSYMLLILGLYEPTINAISSLDLVFLFPMAVGVFAGIILVTKTLEKAMSLYPQPTYLIIIGFVLGSMALAFPGAPVGSQWIVCILSSIIGFKLIYKMNQLNN